MQYDILQLDSGMFCVSDPPGWKVGDTAVMKHTWRQPSRQMVWLAKELQGQERELVSVNVFGAILLYSNIPSSQLPQIRE